MVDLEKELKGPKAERSQLRRLTTKACSELEDEFIGDETMDLDVIEEKFHVLADRVERLFKLDEQVREILIEIDCSEDEPANEFDSVEQYRSRWLKISLKRNRLVNDKTNLLKVEETIENVSDTSTTARNKLKHMKLVRLEPKKFYGGLHNWIGFWSMFISVDEDEDLAPEQKFQYLLQFTFLRFVDASKLAFAAVVFLRIEYEGRVNVQFITTKSRIAPHKSVTIPRLELLAAVIGARLSHGVLENLDRVQEIVYWTDPSTVLWWIQKEEPWSVFVNNRVKEIRLLTEKNSWHHITGVLNPADLASRGCSPKALAQSRWWEGPLWLKLPQDEWPISVTPNEEEVFSERKKRTVLALNTLVTEISVEFVGRFSWYFRVVRVIGWISRFVTNAKKGICTKESLENRIYGDLSIAECVSAERKLLKLVQIEFFPQYQHDKSLRRLKPTVDSHGLIRIRTKIWARKDAEDFRAPVVVEPGHPIVDMLLKSFHTHNKHVAGHGLLNMLREKYWVLRGKQAVRRTVKECVTCQKVYSKNLEVDPPPLSEDRVRDACIFEVIGTDLAGPLYLRDGTKVWLVIFTCTIFLAVHMDIVTSQSTEGFVLALRRFIARRGRPSIIYSYNGTNFRGSCNLMQALDWEKIKDNFSTQPIEWRFNPPTGSWWGGFYERLIGLVKALLKKNLGRASLEYSELYTLTCECEMYINDRPITYVSDTNDGPVPITPSMFLQEIRQTVVPDREEMDAASLQRRIRYRQKIKQELRAPQSIDLVR